MPLGQSECYIEGYNSFFCLGVVEQHKIKVMDLRYPWISRSYSAGVHEKLVCNGVG